MTGIEAFLEVLAAAGVTHLFGNPGTTELPLNDALARDERFRYILGLHEVPVVGMADGYAQASGRVGVVNVHVSCGLGNAMGMLYNAHRAGTPLLLTAGQQDRRLRLSEPVLVGDLVSVAPALDEVGLRGRASRGRADRRASRRRHGVDATDGACLSVAANRRADGG